MQGLRRHPPALQGRRGDPVIWSQMGVGGRQTLERSRVRTKKPPVEMPWELDTGSVAICGAAAMKMPTETHCCPVLQGFPVFAKVSASLQQPCPALSAAMSSICMVCSMGQTFSGDANTPATPCKGIDKLRISTNNARMGPI